MRVTDERVGVLCEIGKPTERTFLRGPSEEYLLALDLRDARADAARLAEAAGEALVPIVALVIAEGDGTALSPEVKVALDHAAKAVLAALRAHEAVKP